MLDTVVFDLDGTLLDTLGDLRASVNHALAKRGHPLRTPDEIRAFLGNGAKRLITLSAPEGTDEREIERLLALFKRAIVHKEVKHYDKCYQQVRNYFCYRCIIT